MNNEIEIIVNDGPVLIVSYRGNWFIADGTRLVEVERYINEEVQREYEYLQALAPPPQEEPTCADYYTGYVVFGIMAGMFIFLIVFICYNFLKK